MPYTAEPSVYPLSRGSETAPAADVHRDAGSLPTMTEPSALVANGLSCTLIGTAKIKPPEIVHCIVVGALEPPLT